MWTPRVIFVENDRTMMKFHAYSRSGSGIFVRIGRCSDYKMALEKAKKFAEDCNLKKLDEDEPYPLTDIVISIPNNYAIPWKYPVYPEWEEKMDKFCDDLKELYS